MATKEPKTEPTQGEAPAQEQKKLKVELPVNEWQVIYNALIKSSAPFIQVNAIFNELDKQLKTQT